MYNDNGVWKTIIDGDSNAVVGTYNEITESIEVVFDPSPATVGDLTTLQSSDGAVSGPTIQYTMVWDSEKANFTIGSSTISVYANDVSPLSINS